MMTGSRYETALIRRSLAVAMLLIAAGCAALPADMPVARWCAQVGVPDAVGKLLHLSEVFGHGIGVVGILISVWVVDAGNRWRMPRLVMASLGAGLIANLGKVMVARTRPHHFDFSQGISASFLGWFPSISRPSFEQGFPSSHVATAVGLAVGLSWWYPRGRVWFACLAMLVAAQRIESGAHFLSDTCWGAAVGLIIAAISIRLRSLGYLGNRLERWLLPLEASVHTADAPESKSRFAA
jgi:membrane-associated phospholipid phosphatase